MQEELWLAGASPEPMSSPEAEMSRSESTQEQKRRNLKPEGGTIVLRCRWSASSVHTAGVNLMQAHQG